MYSTKHGTLVFKLDEKEVIMIGTDIFFAFDIIGKNKVKLLLRAPKEIPVKRFRAVESDVLKTFDDDLNS
jgi:sRNA-binding carbon storage regulator CsrA